MSECGLCQNPPTWINEVVYTTEAGRVFHNWRDCAYLNSGQLKAENKGFSVHPISPTNWASVFYEMGPCEWCCAMYNSRNETRKSCEILHKGNWAKGELLTERKVSAKEVEYQVFLFENDEIFLVNSEEFRLLP